LHLQLTLQSSGRAYILSFRQAEFLCKLPCIALTAEDDKPDRSTLSRWLKRATQQRLICCSGSGYRGDGSRYWLPGREPLLWPGDSASEADEQAWRDRCAAHSRSR
jgi:hypothetical protein